jgi:hypothetical protein
MATASPQRIAANRRNAHNSTGPKTPAGKQIVSRNALRHGLLATNPVLFAEEQPDFDRLADALHYEYQPQTSQERLLVNRAVDLSWRLQRASQIETGLFVTHRKKELEQPHTPANREAGAYAEDMEARNRGAQTLSAVFTRQSGAFARLNRHEAHLHRLLEKTVTRLESLQYARNLQVDPHYVNRMGRFPAVSENGRKEEGQYRARPATAEAPTSEPRGGYVFFDPPAEEEVVEELYSPDELEQATMAAASVPEVYVAEIASVEGETNGFRDEEVPQTEPAEAESLATTAVSDDGSPSEGHAVCHARASVSAKQSQFAAEPAVAQEVGDINCAKTRAGSEGKIRFTRERNRRCRSLACGRSEKT